MESLPRRYSGLSEGRFHRKSTMDRDLRPGELAGAIARAKAGDRDAVRYLYLRFADNVYGYARSIVQDEYEAEDVTQQVFARLMTALGRYEPRAVPFSAWLLRITHNAAIDHMRRRLQGLDAGERAPEATAGQDGELVDTLRSALQQLPEVQRQVVVMRHVGGYSPGEIASALDRSEDAVHGLHHRGRRALKDALARAGAAPSTFAA